MDTIGSNSTSEYSTPDPPTLPSGSGHSGLVYPSLRSIPISSDLQGTGPVLVDENHSDGDDLEHIDLRKQLSALSLDSVDDRFFGQSRLDYLKLNIKLY